MKTYQYYFSRINKGNNQSDTLAACKVQRRNFHGKVGVNVVSYYGKLYESSDFLGKNIEALFKIYLKSK